MLSVDADESIENIKHRLEADVGEAGRQKLICKGRELKAPFTVQDYPDLLVNAGVGSIAVHVVIFSAQSVERYDDGVEVLC